MNLTRLTCNPKQAAELLNFGILPAAFFWHYYRGESWVTEYVPFEQTPSKICVPAWTKAELDAMIGPRYQKPDLWSDDRAATSKVQNPNEYPIFTHNVCYTYDNGAVASAAGLLILLESDFLTYGEANERYKKIFLKHSSLYA